MWRKILFKIGSFFLGVINLLYNKKYPMSMPKFSDYDVTSKSLDKYTGVYSDTLMKLNITKVNKSLSIKTKGKVLYTIYEASGENKFTNDATFSEIKFLLDKNKLILRTMGKKYTLTKEN